MTVIIDGTAGITFNNSTIQAVAALPLTGGTLTGNLVIGSGANGITFPATQSASSDANTLDDYEEGTFSPAPTPSAGSFTSVSSSGRYTKIGRQVTVSVSISITTVGTASGTINFTIPFSTDGNTYVGEAIETAAVGITGPVLVSGTNGTIRKYDWSGVVIGTSYSWQATVTYFV